MSLYFLVGVMALAGMAGIASASNDPVLFEAEPLLLAADLVPPALLNGPGYQVEAEVPVIGYQARFTLRTPYGELAAESVEMLAIRITEMPAVEALYQEDISATLAQSGADAVRTTGAGLTRVVSHPIKTLTGLPRGVARYFSRQWKRLDARLTRLGDSVQRRMTEEGNPYGDAEGPLTSTRVEDPKPRPWYRKPTREVEGLVRGELGYGRARRALAQELGIDPATSNPLLVPRLDALSWVRAGGHKASSLALGGLGDVSDALGDVSRLDEVVWTLEPEDLRARNDERLAPHCHDDLQRRRFLRHGAFTPTLQTRLVETLREIAPSHGCEALLDLALMTDSEVEARFILNALALAQAYLGAGAQGMRLVPTDSSLAIQSEKGEWLLPLPVDVLSWTEEIQTFFDRQPARQTETLVLVSGHITLRAQRELTRRGYGLLERFPYPGAPPYAASPSLPESASSRLTERCTRYC